METKTKKLLIATTFSALLFISYMAGKFAGAEIIKIFN